MTQAYKPVRMGMVGGGQGAFIGQVHRMAAALDGRIQIVCGAFSQSYENTLHTGGELGLVQDRLYSDWQGMIASEAARPEDDRMEFVCIVTPNHLHVPIATRALKSGFHVMSDKPAGISLQEVKALAELVSQTGHLYGLTHTYLGYPMVWQARYILQSKALGEVRRIFVEYPQGWLASNLETEGAKQAVWRTDPARAGLAGCMGDIGTHAHSLVEFITGSPMIEVAANLRAHIAGRALDDDGEVSFRLANGATGVLTASQICAGEENALNIRIYGEKGGLEWHQMSPNSLLQMRLEGPALLHRAGTDKPLAPEALKRCRLPAGHPEGYIEAFANLYVDFAKAVRSGQTGRAEGVPGLSEALSGMAFLEAITDSHKKGGVSIAMPVINGLKT